MKRCAPRLFGTLSLGVVALAAGCRPSTPGRLRPTASRPVAAPATAAPDDSPWKVLPIYGGRTWHDFHQGLPRAPSGFRPAGGPTPYRYQAYAAGRGFYLVADAEGTLYRRGAGDVRWTKVERGSVSWGDPACETSQILERKRRTKRFECAGSIVIDPSEPSR